MSSNDTLAALIERVEKATAEQQGEVMLAALDALNLPVDPHYRIVAMIEARAYESAAVSLVPEGWAWRAEWYCAADLGWMGCGLVYTPCDPRDDEAPRWAASAATPALALVAAALRARMESAE